MLPELDFNYCVSTYMFYIYMIPFSFLEKHFVKRGVSVALVSQVSVANNAKGYVYIWHDLDLACDF